MTESDQAADQARFAAREFLARWKRESGEVLPPLVANRVLFVYEIGYLRGRREGMQAAMRMFDELRKQREDDR